VWVERRGNPPVPVHAPLDWGAHVLTALIALRAFPAAEEREVLVSTVAIDLDHVPIVAAMLRGDDLPRPRTHTFLVPLALALVGRRGSAYGTFVHLGRDVFNGPGVGRLRLPVALEAAALGAPLICARTREAGTDRRALHPEPVQ
jgi:hypothetical protein